MLRAVLLTFAAGRADESLRGTLGRRRPESHVSLIVHLALYGAHFELVGTIAFDDADVPDDGAPRPRRSRREMVVAIVIATHPIVRVIAITVARKATLPTRSPPADGARTSADGTQGSYKGPATSIDLDAGPHFSSQRHLTIPVK